MNSTVLEAQAQHGCRRLFAVENALDLAIELEKVVLTHTHPLVLDLHCLFDAFLQINDDLIGPFRLDVLVNIAVRADGIELGYLLPLYS